MYLVFECSAHVIIINKTLSDYWFSLHFFFILITASISSFTTFTLFDGKKTCVRINAHIHTLNIHKRNSISGKIITDYLIICSDVRTRCVFFFLNKLLLIISIEIATHSLIFETIQHIIVYLSTLNRLVNHSVSFELRHKL